MTSAPEIPTELIKRHLGLPPCVSLDADLAGRVRDARTWLATHSRPWTHARQVDVVRIDGDQVELAGGLSFSSQLLARGLAEAEVFALVVLAISAGPEVDERITQLWQDGLPDEAMTLNAVAIATVEHVRAWHFEILRQEVRSSGRTLLPHYSPGYHGWDLSGQRPLYRVICGNGGTAERLPGPLQLLDSGMLTPMRSTLAAMGVSRRNDSGDPFENYWTVRALRKTATAGPDQQRIDQRIPVKALKKWATQNLRIDSEPDGRLRASFRFRGSTCSNMGLPLAFDFHVLLSRHDAGNLVIDDCQCVPSEESSGCAAMCAYQVSPTDFLSSLRNTRPYVTRPLDEVLDWHYDTAPSACLCSRACQNHKWRMVLETVHYALSNETDRYQTNGANLPQIA